MVVKKLTTRMEWRGNFIFFPLHFHPARLRRIV
jgi:hypothetical protein